MKIGIFYNSYGSEKEISILSAENIEKALKKLGYKPLKIPFSPRIDFSALKIDIAFNLAYGKNGEDGTISFLAKELKIPCVGPSLETCRLTYNKLVTKQRLALAGIRIPKKTFLPPLVCKPIMGGSSKDIYFVETKEKMKTLEKFLSSGYYAEEFLPGREFCLCAFKYNGVVKVLPIAEIKKESKVFEFKQKYKPSKNLLEIPAEIGMELAREMEKICLTCFKIFKCDFYTKVDIVLDKERNPCVLEADAIPGFGPNSIMPRCAKAVGISLSKLVKFFLNETVKSPFRADQRF